MKAIVILIMLTVTVTGYGQSWGVGIRVGDPAGLTIKKNMDDYALEINIGGANMLYGMKLYNKGISNSFMNGSFKKRTLTYTINKASIPKGFQIHYLYQKDLSLTSSELQGYYGYGGQFRIQRASYDFAYKIPNDPSWHYTTGPMVTDVDMGLDGIIGLQYTLRNIPISLFCDLSLFLEGADDPFVLLLQGGLGLRYNFSKTNVKPIR